MLRRFGNIFDALATVARVLGVTAREEMGTQSLKRPTRTERIEYPRPCLPAAHRHRAFRHRYDLTSCLGCQRCVGNCPAECIHVGNERIAGRSGFQVSSFSIDYAGCLGCGTCSASCPADCIVVDSSEDPSCGSREGETVDFSRLPPEVAWGRSTLWPRGSAGCRTSVRTVQDRSDQKGGANGT